MFSITGGSEMESRCKEGVIMASTRSAGVRSQWDGVQLFSYRGLLVVALLFVTMTTFVVDDVHCSITTDAVAPAPTPSTQQTQNIATFNRYEADALNAVFQMWSEQNPQLSTLLNWSLEQHPCYNLTGAFEYSTGNDFEGAWAGVGCTSVLRNLTEIPKHYQIFVTSLMIYGSNSGCRSSRDYNQCDFDGIIGQLPSEISNLTNLQTILIINNPKLTGPVPVEIFQLPYLTYLTLYNNSLNGTLPSDAYNADCNLESLDLRRNNFSGNLRLSSQGTLFCSSLWNLNISFNNFNRLFPWEIFGMPLLTDLDLSMNNFFGSIDFGMLNHSIPLRVLYINNNNFNGTFSTSPYFNPFIMDLSNNQFNVISIQDYLNTTFPNGSLYIPNLQKIYFQNNSLRGQFPAHILIGPNLKILNASHNQYETLQLPDVNYENSSFSQILITNNKISSMTYSTTGPFTSSNLQYSSFLFLGGNPICDKIENLVLSSTCRFNRLDQALSVIQKSNAKMKVIIATSTSSAFVLVLLVTAIYVWRLMGKIKALRIIPEEFEKKEVKPYIYSYKEIKLATNNFNKDNKLGEGGFGVVFKGNLYDGTQVAVKKLTMSTNHVLSEFLNEVTVISGLKHRNLVKLKGCCLGDGDQRILVFEYVENKNLAEALRIDGDLQSNIELPCLDWEMRFNIIVGIARGLTYLHEDLQPPIIHRDIKATNILLDKNFNPKIADFGLAYLFPALDSEASHLTLEQVAGTRGYCSPEYALHSQVSTALDVYSFGILVLEIVSGRKIINLQKPSEEIYLRDWAWKQYEAKATTTLIDSNLEYSPIDLEAIIRVIVVALGCVHYKATRRPKMHNVLPMLLGNMPISEFQRDFDDG